MDTRDAILSRRSIRKYTDQSISREDLEEILEAAAWAPSAVNLQPWYFVALHSKEELAKMADAVNLSIGAAIQNILLAAHNKGIGSCWLTAPIEAGVGRELGSIFAPDKGEMVALITLGYPAKVGKPPKRKEGRFSIL